MVELVLQFETLLLLQRDKSINASIKTRFTLFGCLNYNSSRRPVLGFPLSNQKGDQSYHRILKNLHDKGGDKAVNQPCPRNDKKLRKYFFSIYSRIIICGLLCPLLSSSFAIKCCFDVCTIQAANFSF